MTWNGLTAEYSGVLCSSLARSTSTRRDRHALFREKDPHPARVRRKIGIVEFHSVSSRPAFRDKPNRISAENPPRAPRRQPLVNPLDSMIGPTLLRCVPDVMSERKAQSGTAERAVPDAAARRRRMSVEVRRARQILTGPEGPPDPAAAALRLFALIHHEAAPMLGLVALGTAGVALGLVGAAGSSRRGRSSSSAPSVSSTLCRSRFSTAATRQKRGRMGAQVYPRDGVLRLGLGLSDRRAAALARSRRAGLRDAGDAARVDRHVVAGSDHPGRVRRRNAADDDRRRPRLRFAPRERRASGRRHDDRRRRLCPRGRPSPARVRGAQRLPPGGEGLADRRARAGQAEFRRGAATGRERQSRQVALPRHHEPRAAHAAQRHPGLLGGDEGRAVRSARRRRPTRSTPATSMSAASTFSC